MACGTRAQDYEKSAQAHHDEEVERGVNLIPFEHLDDITRAGHEDQAAAQEAERCNEFAGRSPREVRGPKCCILLIYACAHVAYGAGVVGCG